MTLAITLAPARSAARRPLEPCPGGCRTVVKAPVQGLVHAVFWCIECHTIYVVVPLHRWREYVWRPVVPAQDARILPFQAG